MRKLYRNISRNARRQREQTIKYIGSLHICSFKKCIFHSFTFYVTLLSDSSKSCWYKLKMIRSVRKSGLRTTTLKKKSITLECERMAKVYAKLFLLWIETLSAMFKNINLFPTCENSAGFFKWTLQVSILTLLLCMCEVSQMEFSIPRTIFSKATKNTNRIQSSYAWYTLCLLS